MVMTYGNVRVVGKEHHWVVEKQGRSRLFGLIQGHWHCVECHTQWSAAIAHVKRIKAQQFLNLQSASGRRK